MMSLKKQISPNFPKFCLNCQVSPTYTTTKIIAKNSAPNKINKPDALTKLKIKNKTEWTGFLALITIKAEKIATSENR